jgi:hypothetical protein
MINLLEEIKQKLEENKKTLEDIVWVGTENYKVNIEQFLELANTYYDNGYGGQEVATNLIVCGDNWWLERAEYDGSEWWEYKELPIKPTKELGIKAITISQAKELDYGISCIWKTLEELNNIEEEIK